MGLNVRPWKKEDKQLFQRLKDEQRKQVEENKKNLKKSKTKEDEAAHM